MRREYLLTRATDRITVRVMKAQDALAERNRQIRQLLQWSRRPSASDEWFANFGAAQAVAA
jgi:hypothetical protein